MPRATTISPFVTGDPIRVGPELETLPDVLRVLRLDAAQDAVFLPLAPEVGLVWTVVEREGMTLRWVRFVRARSLVTGAPSIGLAAVLAVPLRDCGRGVRVVACLRACLRDPELVDRVRAATTREEVVEALGQVASVAGESPLPPADVLTLLGSARTGLSTGEAARRRLACGPNRLERVRRRPLTLRAGNDAFPNVARSGSRQPRARN